MTNPYTKAAKVLDDPTGKRKASLRPAAAPPKEDAPMRVVGKKYVDAQSQADEQYMTGAQRRINTRLARGVDAIADEALKPKRKGFGLLNRR